MIDAAPKYDKDWFVNYLDTITKCWHSLLGLSFSRQRLIDEAITIGGSISDALSNNFTWMISTLKKINIEYENYYGRSEYINSLLNNCQIMKCDVDKRREIVQILIAKVEEAGGIDSVCDRSDVEKYEDMLCVWTQIQNLVGKNLINFNEAHNEVLQYESKIEEINIFLDKKREIIDTKLNISETSNDGFERHIKAIKKVQSEFDRYRDNFSSLVAQGTDIINKCNPQTVEDVSSMLQSFINRWNDTESSASLKKKQINKILEERKEKNTQINNLRDEIMNFRGEIIELERNLHYNNSPDQLNYFNINLKDFETRLKKKREQVESVIRKDLRQSNTIGVQSNISRFRSHAVARIDSLWKDIWSRSSELKKQIKNLISKHGEIQRLDNFSIESWLENLKIRMAQQKLTFSNLFKMLDKNVDGVIDRNDFIFGILNLYPYITNESELERIWSLMKYTPKSGVKCQRFVDGLKSLSKMKTKKSENTLDAEMASVIKGCTCSKTFSIHKVADGIYKFGESNLRRLVRITPSAAMVRVGGGWLSIEEFLMRNDPCQIKRTLSSRGRSYSELSISSKSETIGLKKKVKIITTAMKFQRKIIRNFPQPAKYSVTTPSHQKQVSPFSSRTVGSLPTPSASIKSLDIYSEFRKKSHENQ